MTYVKKQTCTDCNKLNYDYDIVLVDEQSNPVAGVPYTFRVSDMIRSGVTSDNGEIIEKGLKPGIANLTLEAEKLAEVLQEPERILRLSRNWKDSSVRKQSLSEGRDYAYLKMGELVSKVPNIVGWADKEPPTYHFPSYHLGLKGYFISFKGKDNKKQKITLEVCPFRAWVLDLTHKPDYDLINAYNLALMSVLAYAYLDSNESAMKATNIGIGSKIGSIKHFFINQMQDLSKLPHRLNDLSANPIVKDVPFRERYMIPAFINTENSASNVSTPDTQFFYVERVDELLISWRGTASIRDWLTDANFKPHRFDCQVSCTDILSNGKIHEGFYNAFNAVNDTVDSDLNDAFEKIKELADSRKVFICGHSLGGALAIIHSTVLQHQDPCLYTYGMPRTFTKKAIENIKFTHYRHVNENDTVTSVPADKNLDNFGYGIFEPLGYTFSLVQMMNPFDSDDGYFHHGKLAHFYQTNTWYSQKISENNRDRYIRRRLPSQTKLYLIPTLSSSETNAAAHSQEEIDKLFPVGGNPDYKGGVGLSEHSSLEYAGYINKRLTGLLDKILGEVSYDAYDQQQLDYLISMKSYSNNIPVSLQNRENRLLRIDGYLSDTLQVSSRHRIVENGLIRYWEINTRLALK
ncbi:dienelactone hydrolase family protein [Aeromonas sp. sia0103]|uniref:lipase family protein n=1 Tax=Aeromonas sp. sia0103 TaxID=2854782 RepID=UPI001C466B87|nr:lipase family protein [Aeromonas sp. sia0103]MBV7597499.1 lipase family protein [Aeromonas sp. sia0103]